MLKGFGHRTFDTYVAKRHEGFRKTDDSRLEQDRLRREQISSDQAYERARAKPVVTPPAAEVAMVTPAPVAQVMTSAVKPTVALDPDNFDDLNDFDDDELAFLAGKYHVTVEQLKKVQKLQRMAAKATQIREEQ